MWRTKPDSCRILAIENYRAAENLDYAKGMAQSCSNIALSYKFSEPDSVIKYFQRSIQHRKNWGVPEELAKGYRNLADYYLDLNEHKKSLANADSALMFLKPGQSPKLTSKVYTVKAKGFFQMGKYSQSSHYVNLALDLINPSDSQKEYASLMQVSGGLATRTFEYDSACVRFQRAWKIHEKRKDSEKMGNAAHNIGVSFFLNENPDSAEFWFRKSLSLRQPEDSNFYAGTQNSIGLCYQQRGQVDSAIFYFKQALQTLGGLSKSELASGIYKNLSDCYLELGDEKIALEMINKSIDYAPEISNPRLFEQTLSAKAVLEAANNNFEDAYLNLEESVEHSLENYQEVHYHNDLEFQRQNLSASIQQKDLELQIQKEKREFWIAAGGLLFTLMFSGFGLVFLRQRQQNKLQEAEFKAERAKNELREKAREGIIDAEKAERERIGQQLHDLLGTSLTLLRLQFEGLEDYLKEAPLPIQEKFHSSYDLLKRTGSEVREISHKMSAPYLRELGLSAAVEDLCEKIRNSTEIEVDFHAHGMEKRLPPSFEGVLYQWTRELLNNSLKHAQASEISVQVNRFEENENTLVNIIIEDNGKGFPIQNLANGKKTGLSGLRERVQEMNGTLEIDSSPQRGTSISIDISI